MAGQVLLQITDDLQSEATKGDPNDVSILETFPFCSSEDITSNVYDISLNNSLSVFPNPAAHFLFIQNNDESAIAEQISIYDVNGQVVLIEKQAQAVRQLNVNTLGQGHYFIRIDMDNNKSYSSSFYKE